MDCGKLFIGSFNDIGDRQRYLSTVKKLFRNAVLTFVGVINLAVSGEVLLESSGREVEKDNTRPIYIGVTCTEGETWTATTDSSTSEGGWIRLIRSQGTNGVSVAYLLTHNYSTDVRVGHITVSGRTYSVTQLGYGATLDADAATVPAAGVADRVITFELETASDGHAISWTAKSDVDWITVLSESGEGNGSVSYRVDENTSIFERTAMLTIAGRPYAVTQQASQDPVDLHVQLIPIGLTTSFASKEFTVEAMADDAYSWEADSDADWCRVLGSRSGQGEGTLQLAVSENPSVLARTAHVTVGDNVFTVVQLGCPAQIEFEPSFLHVPYAGGATSVNMVATQDLSWYLSCWPSWMEFPSGTSGTGGRVLPFEFADNPELQARTGEVGVSVVTPLPEVDFSRGLTLWRGANCANWTTYDDSSMRDPMVPGQTDGIMFRMDKRWTLRRLLDLDDGTGVASVFVSREGRLMLDRQDTGATDLVFTVQTNVVYDLFFVSCPQTAAGAGYTRIYAGRHDCGSYRLLREIDVPLTVSKCGYSSRPSPGELEPENGTAFNGIFYHWNRCLTTGELLAFPRTIEQDLPTDEVYENLYSHTDLKRFCYVRRDLSEVQLRCTNLVVSSNRHGVPSSAISPDFATPSFPLEYAYCYGYTKRYYYFKTGEIRNSSVNIKGRYNQVSDLENLICCLDAFHQAYATNDLVYTDSYSMESRFSGASIGLNHQYRYEAYVNSTFNMWIRFSESSSVTNGPFFVPLCVEPFLRDWECWGTYDPFTRNIRRTFTKPDFYAFSFANGRLTFMESSVSCGSLEDGKWHMLTLVADGSDLVVYVDGAAQGRFAFSDALAYDAWSFHGNRGTVFLDDFKVFHASLDAGRIGQIYAREKPISRKLTVTQKAATPVLSERRIECVAAGTNATVTVALPDYVHWTAQSEEDWVAVTSGGEGTGPGAVTFTVARNTETWSRSTVLSIAGIQVEIIQEGAEIWIPDDVVVADYDGDFVTVHIEADHPSTHWIVDEATCPEWILSVDGDGVGSRPLELAVLECRDGEAGDAISRMGIVTVSGRQIYVSQRNFGLALQPASLIASGKAGSGTVSVATETDAGLWGVVTDSDWISLTGAHEGYGSQTLRYTLEENPTGSARIGRIIVAGEVCTITQRANCVVSGLQILGSDIVDPDGESVYAARIAFSNGEFEDVENVEWSASGDGAIRQGVLTVGASCGRIVITASCMFEGVRYSIDKTIIVMPRPNDRNAVLGGSGLLFEDAGDAAWRIDPRVSHDEAFSMRSGEVATPRTSDLVAMTNGAGTVSCWMKASTTSDGPVAEGQLLVDGVVVAQVRGEVEWTNIVYSVSAWADHELRWRYVGGESGSGGIWLDEVVWTPRVASVTNLVVEGPENVLGGTSVLYRCRAFYDDGTSRIVPADWTLASGGTRGQVDGTTGELSFAQNGGDLVVRASYTEGEVSCQADLHVVADPAIQGSDILGPATVYMGETAHYTNRIQYAGGRIEYAASDWAVSSGTITQQGVFSPVRPGEATISSIFSNKWQKVSQSRKINVLSALVSLEIVGPAACERGSTAVYKAKATFADGTQEDVSATWTVSSGTIAGGVFSPSDLGMTTISASYRRGSVVKSATLDVEVYRFLETIEIDGVADPVKHGEQKTFTCTAHYGDGTEEVVTPVWTASKGSITAQGEYTATTVGRVEISAQYEERGVRRNASVSFAVERVPCELSIDGPDQVFVSRSAAFGCWLVYSDGTRQDLTTATWKTTMGVMSSYGVFRFAESGSATVTAEYVVEGKQLSASKTIKVLPTVREILIFRENQMERDLFVGRRSRLICLAFFSNNTSEYVNPVWSIVDGPAVIDGDGWVTPSAEGMITVRAEFYDGDTTVSKMVDIWVSDWIALTVVNTDSVSTIDPGLVTSVVVKASVGRIPFRMFDSYTNLQHVVVESGVTEIGEEAFTQCRALREIKLGEGIENIKRLAFLNCESLREITIPNSVTNIGDFVWGWSGLTNVVVGSGVKRIDEKAFVGCSKLRNITFLGNAPVGGPNVLDGTPRSLTNWVYRASTGWSTEWPVGDVYARPVAIIDPAVVNGVLTVGSVSDMNYVDRASVTSVVVKASIGRIPESMFHSYSNLLHVVIEPGVTGIGSSAFSQCKALEDIVLGEGILTMDRLAFLNCESLREITIPNSVTNIGEYSFGWAPKLTNVVVGCGVKNIDRGAFADCHNLSRITFLGNAPTSGSEVFKGTPQGLTNWIYRASTGWASEWPVGDVYARPVAIIDPAVVNGVLTVGSVSDTNYVDRASVTSVVVKAGLSIVPPEMFRGWPELLSVVIEEGVREIRYAAFGHCPKLRTAEIAQSVTNVEACVFQFCGQLRRADLPSGVDKIENCTFSNCTNLESTVIPDSVKWIGDYAYIECEALRKVFIGSGVTNLGEFAFNNCVNLEVATIGGRVKNLANDVFSGCRRLRDVFFEGNAPTASSNVFAGTPHGLTNWVHQSAVGWLAQWPSNDTNARPVSYVDVVKRTYGVGETLWVSDFSTWGATSTNDVLTMNAGSTIRVRPGATNSSRGWRIPLALKGGEVVLDLSLYDDETPFWIARSVYSEDGSWLRVKNSRNKRIRLGSPSPMNYDIDFWGSPQLRSDGGFGTVISDGALVFEDCPTVEVWHGIGLYHDLEGCAVVYLKDGTNASTCYPVVLAMGTDFYRGQKSIDLLDHVLVLMAQDVAGAGQCLHIGANINLYSSPVATFRVSATDVYLATAGNPVVKADIALAGGNIYAAQASHEFTGALSGQGTISISGWGGSAILRNSAASTVDLGVVCSQRGTRLQISNSSLFRGSISTFSSSTESQAGTYGGSKFGGAQQSYALNYIDAISTDGADSVFAVEQYQLRTVATPTNGAAIKVYSGQTFSIGTLSGTGVHVLDSAGRAGNLVIGTASTSQNWYLPTNVNVTVSNFNPTATGQSIVFDTSHGNNQTVFAIKNANATARTWRMKAISPRMLPRRIEGFTGDLVLGPLPQGDKQTTVTENNWVFPFNSDLADPNVNGCAGSGTLSVPPTGSIRLVFSGTKPLRGGTYPLLTATSGGNALSASAWPVTVEGSVPTGYEIVRDATGISLRIPTVAAEEVVYEDAEGQMFSVSVPHAWLESYPTILSSFDGDFAAAARGRSPGQTGKGKSWDNGKPMYMWQDYLAGTDPLDTNSVFRARIDMVNGVPCLSWTPDLKSTRSYIIYGTPSLVPSSWHSPTNANDRFFKVGVEVK